MSDYTNYVPQAACTDAVNAEYTPNMCVDVDIAEQQDPKQQRIAKMFVSAADVAYTPPQWLIKPYIQMGKGTLILLLSDVHSNAHVRRIVCVRGLWIRCLGDVIGII